VAHYIKIENTAIAVTDRERVNNINAIIDESPPLVNT